MTARSQRLRALESVVSDIRAVNVPVARLPVARRPSAADAPVVHVERLAPIWGDERADEFETG